MAEAKQCAACEGFGKVASSNGKSWLQFSGKHYFSEEMTEVREGNTEPRVCPDCNGTGSIDSELKAKAKSSLAAASPNKTK